MSQIKVPSRLEIHKTINYTSNSNLVDYVMMVFRDIYLFNWIND